ncbi:MAG: DNA polymerase III subunit chi, partial [Pseudomonadota bacterium]
EMSGRYTDPLFVAAVLCGRAWPACGRLTIVGEPGQLNELDERLWHEPAGRFLPHSRTEAGENSALADNTIMLSEQAPQACDVLINLQPNGPLAEGRYTRILEIVPQDEPLKQALRQRWMSWKQRGAELHHHRLK